VLLESSALSLFSAKTAAHAQSGSPIYHGRARCREVTSASRPVTHQQRLTLVATKLTGIGPGRMALVRHGGGRLVMMDSSAVDLFAGNNSRHRVAGRQHRHRTQARTEWVVADSQRSGRSSHRDQLVAAHQWRPHSAPEVPIGGGTGESGSRSPASIMTMSSRRARRDSVRARASNAISIRGQWQA